MGDLAVFILLASFVLQQQLRTNRPALNTLAFLFLTVFVTTLYILAAGLVGALRPAPILISSVSGIAAKNCWTTWVATRSRISSSVPK